MLTLTIIEINPRHDGVTHLFVNDSYILGGDEYHYSISAQIEGIKNYLKATKQKFEVEKLSLDLDGVCETDIWEFYEAIPERSDSPISFFDRLQEKLKSIN